MLTPSDRQLARDVESSFLEERKCQCRFLEKLGKFDERHLYLPLGYSSIFAYCTRALGLSEGSAAKRIVVARLGRKFPAIYELLSRNECTMTSLWILAPVFTDDNRELLIPKLKELTKFQAEQIKVSFLPRSEKRPVIRLEPVRGHLELSPPLPPPLTNPVTIETGVNPLPAATIDVGRVRTSDSQPMSTLPTRGQVPEPRRVGFHFTAGEMLLSKFRRAQTLMRHRYPKGDPEGVFSEALDALLDRDDPQRSPPSSRASFKSDGRRVPEGLRLRVWHRDGGRCTYLNSEGKRCGSEEFLEVDHIRPWSLGGKTEMNNLRLLCAPHHRYYTQKTFPETKPTPPLKPSKSARTVPGDSA